MRRSDRSTVRAWGVREARFRGGLATIRPTVPRRLDGPASSAVKCCACAALIPKSCRPRSWTTWPAWSGQRSPFSVAYPAAPMRVAMRVQLAGRANAVLKAAPRAHRNHLDETLRAQRVVEHMRRRGYPTPAWLGVGATATHVWHLMDFVHAAPAPELTPSLVEQLMEIIELQAGQASEPNDHWSYAWRLATGQESGQDLAPSLSTAVAGLSGYSSVVSALVERLRLVCADVPPPRESPDMVHTDLNPSNVLVRDGAVVAVVDIGNAGSGTRATDLINLVWQTFQDPLDCVRRRLWTRILVLVGWEGAAVLAATPDPREPRAPHPSRAPRCRARGGQARPSRPRRAERASLTVAGGEEPPADKESAGDPGYDSKANSL